MCIMYYIFALSVFVVAVAGGYSGSSSVAENGVNVEGDIQATTIPPTSPTTQLPQGSAHVPASGGVSPHQLAFFDFHNALAGYLNTMRMLQQQQLANKAAFTSYAYTSSLPNNNAKASASLIIDNNYRRNQYQPNSMAAAHFNMPMFGFTHFGFPNQGAAAFGGFVPGGFGGGFGAGSFSGVIPPGAGMIAPPDGNMHGSMASASIGADGSHQSAAVFPENSQNPNIFNKFHEHPGQQQPNGNNFYGVFTSSSSSSMTGPDGKVIENHEAITSVDNNGKVTTYKVKNP